jgi:hypothetical protein
MSELAIQIDKDHLPGDAADVSRSWTNDRG